MSGAGPAAGPTAAGAAERWRRVEDLFERASELDEAERGEFLRRACGDDVSLREEVAKLLASAPGAGADLGGLIASEARRFAGGAPGPQAGRRVGPYRLVEPLGEGGMGVVYLAERDDDEYERRVAVKIMRQGFGSPQAIGRFRAERQILAALKHPGIVSLLEGGHTDDGLPYLVLELVDGVPITSYAGERELGVRARVGLLLGVCAALQYAHGQLVVHRDIKPSNILVDRAGATKLLDFGIAKLLDAGPEGEARTRPGGAPLTFEYASPEQLRGEPVSVATDVYSLGGVLYELITGRPPRPGGGRFGALRADVREAEPPRPSAVAPPELRREVAGDLDTIVEKALRRDPAERYASVEQFADDLQRYLDGRPVRARAMTPGYRFGKFARRHRGKLALAALVAGALSTAVVVSMEMANRAGVEAKRAEAEAKRAEAEAKRAGVEAKLARERYDEGRAFANAVLFEVDEAIRDVAGGTPARELMARRVLAYLDRLADQPGRDPALNRELALAYMKLGDILGSPFDPNVGKLLEGLRSYEKAEGLLVGLDDADPAVAEARLRAAFGIGFMHSANRDIGLSQANLVDALRRARAAPAGAGPDRVTLIRAHLALAFNEIERNDIVESERHIDEGLTLAGQWDPRSDEARYWRAELMLQRADAAARGGDLERATAVLREIVALRAALANEHPNASKYRRAQAYALLLLGVVAGGVGNSRIWAANTGDLGAAEAAFREGALLLERAAADDPRDADSKVLLAVTRTSLALVVARRSPRDAAPLFARALEAHEAIPAETRASTYGRENEFVLHCAAAPVLAAARRPEARTWAETGLKLASSDPFLVATCEYLVAAMDRELGDPAGAIARLESVVRALEPAAGKPDTSALIGLVEALQQLAVLRPADACSLRAEALAHWRSRPATTPYLRRRADELAAAVEACKKG